MMRLLSVCLLQERVADWSVYPFVIPAIRTLESLEIHSQMGFFVGENGSGKSTLIEAIAESYGFGREGGSRNFYRETVRYAHISGTGVSRQSEREEALLP